MAQPTDGGRGRASTATSEMRAPAIRDRTVDSERKGEGRWERAGVRVSEEGEGRREEAGVQDFGCHSERRGCRWQGQACGSPVRISTSHLYALPPLRARCNGLVLSIL